MLKNKKGFSLVELIVVIAIMAVLVGILAPTLISYVEKSRVQKDESAAEEIRNAINVAINDEDVYDEVIDNLNDGSLTLNFEISDKTLTAATEMGTKLSAALAETIKFPVEITSKKYNKDYESYTVVISSNGNVLSVAGAWT